MTAYTTLDYLPDLTVAEISKAQLLTFQPYTPTDSTIPWDYSTAYSTSESYALLRDTFVWTGQEGATYDIFSHSFFDPFLIQVYDNLGNVIGIDTNGTGDTYGSDYVWDFVAPYSGIYYVSAGWDQGLADAHKFVMLSIYEDIDTVIKIAPNQKVTGSSESETFNESASNDIIDGGAGIDTVVFAGSLASHNIALSTTGFTVSGSGTDVISNCEKLVFSDFSVNLNVKSDAASIGSGNLKLLQELYVAFFNRVPDADGLDYWINKFKSGQSIDNIAESFYDAGVQYSNLTGFSSSMSNADFVNVIYKNVLGRSDGADAGGLAYWTNNLSNGAESRGSLVASILNSAHTFKGDKTWGWVADLLDNKAVVANKFAVDMGLNYLTPFDSISEGILIAAAVTPTDTSAAITLIGVNPDQVAF